MKKALVVLFCFSTILWLRSVPCYDKQHKVYFSYPESSNINPYMYDRIFKQAISLWYQSMGMPIGLSVAPMFYQSYEHVGNYLKEIGSIEAKRVQSDFKIIFNQHMTIAGNILLLKPYFILLSEKDLNIFDERLLTMIGIRFDINCHNLKKFRRS